MIPSCRDHPKKQPYLVMGKKSKGGGDGDDKALTVTFVLPWSRSKVRLQLKRENTCNSLKDGKGIALHKVTCHFTHMRRALTFMKATECVNSSVARFARQFLWKFPRLMGHTTAAVKPGKKKIARGTCIKTS